MSFLRQFVPLTLTYFFNICCTARLQINRSIFTISIYLQYNYLSVYCFKLENSRNNAQCKNMCMFCFLFVFFCFLFACLFVCLFVCFSVKGKNAPKQNLSMFWETIIILVKYQHFFFIEII